MKNDKFFSSLTSVMLVAIIAGTILAAGGFTYTIILHNTLRAQQQKYVLEIAKRAAITFDDRVKRETSTLLSVSEVFENFYSYASLDDYIVALDEINKHNSFNFTGFYFPSSKETYFSNGGVISDFLPSSFVSRVLSGETDMSGLIDGPIEHKPVMVFGAPFYVNNRVEAIIFGVQDISWYKKMLSSYKIDGYGFVMLIDDEGEIIMASEEGERLPVENMSQALSMSTLDKGLSYDDFMQDLQQGETGVIGYQVNKTKAHRFLAYVKLSLPSVKTYYLAFVVPSYAVAKQTKKIIIISLLLCLSILLAFALILLFLDYREKMHTTLLFNTAFKDPLTGASNMGKFRLDLEGIISQNFGEKFALVVLDIDKFKVINDLYGNRQGDLVLTHMANVLEENIKPPLETFGRVIGDIFLLLIKYSDEKEIAPRLEKIYKEIQNCYAVTDIHYEIDTVFGVYKIEDDIPFYLMFDRAGLAKKMAKEQQNTKYIIYEDSSLKRVLNDKEIENSMSQALREEEFLILFQPKCAFSKDHITSAEVLVRWNTKRKGIIGPDQFIPIFEHNGFILKLDMYVFEKTLKILRFWLDKGLKPYKVSINFSRLHLNEENCFVKIKNLLQKYRIPAELIEITESAAFSNKEKARKFIKNLHNIGFSVAMDDFGAGYSSLNVLKDLPFDTLKLDKEFLKDFGKNPRVTSVLEGTIQMLKKLDANIVAEGVETEEQAEFLKGAKCDLAQGFFYYKPLSAQDFERIIPKDTAKDTPKK